MSSDHASTSTEASYPDPVFQAFAVKTTRGRARDKVDRAVKDLLGTGWRVENYGGKRGNFEVFAREGALTAPEAWALSYQFRAYRGIASAEPVFKAWITDRKDWGVDLDEDIITDAAELEAALFAGIFDWVCGKGKDFEEAKRIEWSLELTRVIQAWSNHFPGRTASPATAS